MICLKAKRLPNALLSNYRLVIKYGNKINITLLKKNSGNKHYFIKMHKGKVKSKKYTFLHSKSNFVLPFPHLTEHSPGFGCQLQKRQSRVKQNV